MSDYLRNSADVILGQDAACDIFEFEGILKLILSIATAKPCETYGGVERRSSFSGRITGFEVGIFCS